MFCFTILASFFINETYCHRTISRVLLVTAIIISRGCDKRAAILTSIVAIIWKVGLNLDTTKNEVNNVNLWTTAWFIAVGTLV